jgi:hypothetical protein
VVNWENEILVKCNMDLQDLLHNMMYKKLLLRQTAEQYMDHCYMQTEVVRKKDFLELACWLNQQSTKKGLGEEFQEGHLHVQGMDFGEDNNVGRSYKVETGMQMRRFKYETIVSDQESVSNVSDSQLRSIKAKVVQTESEQGLEVLDWVETPVS